MTIADAAKRADAAIATALQAVMAQKTDSRDLLLQASDAALAVCTALEEHGDWRYIDTADLHASYFRLSHELMTTALEQK